MTIGNRDVGFRPGSFYFIGEIVLALRSGVHSRAPPTVALPAFGTCSFGTRSI
jgi:hypothetical protein